MRELLQPGERERNALRFSFLGLVVTGNYIWCFVIFVIFMGFEAKRWRDALKSSFGVAMQAAREEGGNFNGEVGVPTM